MLLAACNEAEKYPSPIPAHGAGDGGSIAISRVVSDANLRPPVIDAAVADAMGSGGDDGGNDGPAGDAPSGEPPVVDAPVTRMTVTILSPKVDDVVATKLKFAPQVEVRITAPSFGMDSTLKDVVATLQQKPTNAKVSSTKLNQIGMMLIPESNSLVQSFGDTPLELSGIQSGNFDLVITATTNGGLEVSSTIAMKIDAGPTIHIRSPGENKRYRGSALVDIVIEDDYFGPVKDVEMKVGPYKIAFTRPDGAAGKQYSATIDFNAFVPALEGDQLLTVRATNSREMGTEALATRAFVSDSQGPVIANATPKSGDLVGNVIRISAEVTDLADVLGSSVKAVFANGPGTDYIVPLQPPPAGSQTPVYSAIFDTRNLPFAKFALFPTLSFRAADSLGNESVRANVVSMDNHPPMAELDPPDLRMLINAEDRTVRCGWPFDPVGPDAVDDGDIVPQVFDIRARIEDQGNEPKSGTPNYIPIAGVSYSQLLVLDDTTQPLVVNTNPVDRGDTKRDDYCDSMNPLLVPTTDPKTDRDALLITLTPIKFGGVGDHTNEAPRSSRYSGSFLVGDDLSCQGGGALRPPDAACLTASNMAKAIWGISWDIDVDIDTRIETIRWHAEPHSNVVGNWAAYGSGAGGQLSAIWTIPPTTIDINALSPLCGGTQFDAVANNINDGWACVAVQSADLLGNKQVSRPIRICIDSDNDGAECPHKTIARVTDGTPLVVETVADHGFVTGDTIRVTGVAMKTRVNGDWTVTKVDSRHFSLDGSQEQPHVSNFPRPFGDWVRPPSDDQRQFVIGHAVKTSAFPNCTGTQTTDLPKPIIDPTTACTPWRKYKKGETRLFIPGA